ncbi:MAG: hypothetical protein C4521_08115 [Actinobacteria bacterium]|nr:MAG: hypothetical protein C4521_08115 [Actinomycetota bacterium]
MRVRKSSSHDGFSWPRLALAVAIAWALWQPVLLGHKPGWLYFGAAKYINYVLFPLPFVVAFVLSRTSGRRGWLAGGLTLGLAYLLTLPYNIYVESSEPMGFISYGGTLFTQVFGIGSLFLFFFGLGAGIGYLASRRSSKRESLKRSIADSREESHYAVAPRDVP